MFKFNKTSSPLAILLQFLKNPSKFNSTVPDNMINKHIYSYIFLGIFVSLFLNGILSSVFAKQYLMLNPGDKLYVDLPVIMSSFLTLAFAPIIEELLFRGPLAKGSMVIKRVWLFLITYVMSLTALLYFVHANTQYNLDFVYFGLLIFGAPFCFALIIAIIFPMKLLFKPFVFNSIMYIQAIAFGLSHITNYTYTDYALYFFVPFLIINQMFMGFYNGYLSSKYGIAKSIMAHILNNFFAFSIFYIGSPNLNSTTNYILIAIIAFMAFVGFYYFVTLNFELKTKVAKSSEVMIN